MDRLTLRGVGSLADGLTRVGRRFQLLGAIVALTVIVVVWFTRDHIPLTTSAGYSGVFFLSFVGSVSMVLPVPGLISLCAFSLTLNPFALGLLAGVGEAIGELSGYLVGYGGRGVLEESGRVDRLMKAAAARRNLLICLMVGLFPVFPILFFFYKYSDRLEKWMARRGTLVLFVVSLIPNPVFDLVGIAAGGARYPVLRFLGVVWVGKTLKGILVGYTCYYGITRLPWVD